MTKGSELARPEVRGRADLYAHQAGLEPGEEGVHLAAPQALLEHDAAIRGDAVNLEDVLSEIEADRCNLHDGWLPVGE
jgi:hypothetical protein